MVDPIEQFERWWEEAKANSPLKQKSAVCVSTINPEGYPASRFVDLKAISDAGFTFCTSYDSTKGMDIERDPKTALTFWWDHVGFQVRVLGDATRISDEDALRYWDSRSRDAQITTLCTEQSKQLQSEASSKERFLEKANKLGQDLVQKPDSWGGFVVKPKTIEFLTFREDRLHLREFYSNRDEAWKKMLLQP